MPYFHVLVAFRDAPNKIKCIYSDLSGSDLESKFLKPYRAGRSTLSGSEIIDITSIVSTQIIETARIMELELNDIQKKSWEEIEDFNRQSNSVTLVSIGRGHEPEDIVEGGADVTSKFITAPPGQQASSSLSMILNHPWVVAILGGLVVAGVAAWLGWV